MHSQEQDKKAGAVPQRADQYAALHSRFRWQVDTHFNIAQACCQRWAAESAGRGLSARPAQTAIRVHRPGATSMDYSYADLQHSADALSLALGALGVRRGDRVAIVLPQCFETAVAYMAVLQMGAVAMPLSMLFGPEAL